MDAHFNFMRKSTIEEINLRKPENSRLTAIQDAGSKFISRHKTRIILCECVCGRYVVTTVGKITTGHTLSCGCWKKIRGLSDRITYTKGEIIGTCIFIKELPSEGICRMALFECKCGKIFKSRISTIKSLNQESCGCVRKNNTIKATRTHGRTNTSEYIAWCNIRSRCNNAKNGSFKNYGGRGIKVCERWSHSFENFFKDMGEKPSPKHSLDRIKVSGDYEPSNCRWATAKTQARNKQNSFIIKHKDVSHPLEKWAEITGIKSAVIRARLVIHKWTVAESLFTPIATKRIKSRVNTNHFFSD